MNEERADAGPPQRILLAGGGHAQLAVLRAFMENPLPGADTVLLSPSRFLPYTGMIPGYLAGHYSWEEISIDLAALAEAAKIDFIEDEVLALDADAQAVQTKRGKTLKYNLLSLDVGASPFIGKVPGAAEASVSIKPFEQFLPEWRRMLEDCIACARAGAPFRVVVVGAGAGGTEVALSIAHVLGKVTAGAEGGNRLVEIHLVSDTKDPIPSHNKSVRRKFKAALGRKGVVFHPANSAKKVEEGKLWLGDGKGIDFNGLIWSTQAAAPAWLEDSGLELAGRGFVAVAPTLRTLSHPTVFAAGDVAEMVESPRPKAGVFAVRQGPVLAENLRRAFRNEPLREYWPQRKFLTIVTTGGREAVASRAGGWALEGRWVWRWKDHIDRRWIKQYQRSAANAASRD